MQPSSHAPMQAAERAAVGSQGGGEERGSGTSEQRRRELADFLRTRREKLKPEQVGITQVSRRRTPGLRREEVAELAGVGTTWYTWLEQARDIQPSTEVLRRLGQALSLTAAEMRHMFALAGKAAPVDLDPSQESVSESMRRVLDESIQVPAVLLGARWDVLAINPLAKDIFKDFETLPPNKRNWLYYAICSPQNRVRLKDWESHARRLIAEFRASLSDSLDCPSVTELIDILKAEAPEFAGWWREHDVRDNSAAMVEVEDSGKILRFERAVLRPWENFRYKIVLFTPMK